MNLVFLAREVASPTLESFLTLQPDGTFSLSAGAVQRHQLTEQRWVSVACDTDTNTYYLVFGQSADRKPYPLRSNTQKSTARTFNASAPAKRLWDVFSPAPEAKSLRLAVGDPLAHAAGPLYPLHRDGSTPAPVVPAPAAPEAQATPAAAPETALPTIPAVEPMAPAPSTNPRNIWREEELNYLRAFYPTTSLPELAQHLGRTEAAITFKASTLKLKKAQPAAPATPEPAPATPVAPPQEPAAPAPAPVALEPEPAQQPAPRKTFGLMARAEELTEQWKERELSKATPNEFGEILNILRHVPKDKRGVEMGLLLDRAEAEHTKRLRDAGKEVRRG